MEIRQMICGERKGGEMTMLFTVDLEDCKTYCNDVYILYIQLSKHTTHLID